MEAQAIAKLAATQGEKRSLDQAFYTDADIYQQDMDRIFMRCWLYAGHVSEIPEVGDWFLYELDTESVIITRSSEDRVRALMNVCRHRGSRICIEPQGSAKRLTCRYHGWTYDLDGRLRAAAHMGEDFKRDDIALKSVHCEIIQGMIFISFADQPASLQPAKDDLEECLAPYDLAGAKVAHRQSYPIRANWKLAVENYTECYHCAPAHPEYSRGHSLADPETKHKNLYEEMFARAPACGLVEKQVNHKYREATGFGADYMYERYPLWRGHVTGSKDGSQVAPLMGSITGFYGGCTDFQVGPVTFALAYCDYVVIYAFKPLALDRCDCDITWLVRGDAKEGRDYNKSNLIWLWDVTTEADKRIIENNAAGVGSRFYEPGPYSSMEDYTWEFTSWYLETLRQVGEGAGG